MAKGFRNFILWLSLPVFSLVLGGCFEYEDVEFLGMERFNLEKQSTEQVLVKLDLKINNPNTYNITIKPAVLDIYINGKYAGKTKMKDKIVLKKKTTGVYPFYLQAKTKDLMTAATSSLGAMLTGKVRLGIKGNIKAKAYGVGKKFYINEEEIISLVGQ